MATRELFSVDTDGEPIRVAATATTGTAIHANADAVRDEVYAWATNVQATSEKLSFTVGGTAAADLVTVTIPATSTVQIIDGLRLGSAGQIRAWSPNTLQIRITGYYNRLV